MKHGDQAKAQSAKAKASGKSGSEDAEDVKRSGKVAASSKAGGKRAGKAAESDDKNGGKESSGRAGARGSSGKGRSAAEDVAFHNPAVGSALQRAIETYPNAFRRLTD